MVGHGHGLGKAFGLIIDPPWTDGVHIPPVILRLRMKQRVPVHFRSGSEEEASLFLLRQPQCFVRPQRPYFQRLNGIIEVIHRTGWRGKMEDGIYLSLDKDIIGNIMLDKSEAGVSSQMGYVLRRSCDQVVQAQNFMPFRDEPIAKMTSNKARPSGDKNSHPLPSHSYIFKAHRYHFGSWQKISSVEDKGPGHNPAYFGPVQMEKFWPFRGQH